MKAQKQLVFILVIILTSLNGCGRGIGIGGAGWDDTAEVEAAKRSRGAAGDAGRYAASPSRLMKSKWLKASSILWLMFVMPALGLLPILLLTEIISPYGDAGRYAVAILRELRGLVLPDPAPEASHVQFSELGSEVAWWAVVVAVLIVSMLALYYWWRVCAQRAAQQAHARDRRHDGS